LAFLSFFLDTSEDFDDFFDGFVLNMIS